MAITVEQLLAMLAVDEASVEVYADQYVVVQRDPQPAEDSIAIDTTVRFRLVDLDGNPIDPSAIVPDFTVDIEGGQVLSVTGGVPTFGGSWSGSVTLSTTSDPYVFIDVVLTQPGGGVFVSEQLVDVDIDIDSGTVVVSYQFEIQDLIPPRLIGAEAIGPERARFTFDDDMATTGSGSVLTVGSWADAIATLNVDPKPGVDLTVMSVSVSDVPGTPSIPTAWTFADATERLAYSVTTADIGKVGYQESDATYWQLDTVVLWTEVTIGTQIDVTFQWEQTPDCLYKVTANAVFEDDSGNAMSSQVLAWFDGFVPEQPATRFFDYWFQCLPLKNRQEDSTQDLERFSNCIQEVLTWILYDKDHFTDQFDPDIATDEEVDLMLYDMGNPFDVEELGLSNIQKRKLLRFLVPIYKSKGTNTGIESAILFLLGEQVTVVPYIGDGWILGVDELGSGSIAQLMNDVGDTFDFTSIGAPWNLDIEVEAVPQTMTFVAGDFADPSLATALEVVAALESRLVDAGAYAVKPGQPAVVTSSSAEPYAVSPGDVLSMTINGVSGYSTTFTVDDIATPGAATAAEVAARINEDLGSLIVASDNAGTLEIETIERYDTASILMASTAVETALGLAGASAQGSDLAQIVLYSEKSGREATIGVTGGTANGTLEFSTTTIAATGGSVLAPSNSYIKYSFDIETATVLDSETERLVREIGNYMRPAHCHLLSIRTALPLPWPDGWQLGVSELGVSTELAS